MQQQIYEAMGEIDLNIIIWELNGHKRDNLSKNKN